MISIQENFMRVLRAENPEWVPVECPIDPRFGQGAYRFVTYAGALPEPGENVDMWGVRWAKLTGEQLPYITEHPLASLEEFASYDFPDLNDPEAWAGAEKQPGEGRLRIARQVSSLWERLYFLVGFEKALLALVIQPELVTDALERICVWQIAAARRFIELGVDAVRISDDYGSQTNLLMSPQTWRSLIRPHLSRLVESYQTAGIPVALHSCGNLSLIMDDLVEIGFAAFNIQTNANDIATYKKRYGRRFRVWGGVSTQTVLSSGSPAEIRRAVRDAIELLGNEGCLILEPDQLVNIQQENLAIYWEAAREMQPVMPTQNIFYA